MSEDQPGDRISNRSPANTPLPPPRPGELDRLMPSETGTEIERTVTEAGTLPVSEARCAQLVGSCLRGQHGDFTELFALTEPVVRRLLGRLARDRADIDDLVQETYLRAWKGLGGFRGTSRFTTWLFRIAVNVTYTWRQRQRPTLSLREIPEASIPAAPDLGDDTIIRAYARALDGLPADLRTTFVLHETEGLSYRDVAEVLQCPIGTVMSRLHRARARLIDEIREQLEEMVP